VSAEGHKDPLSRLLSERVALCDGAMGTMLHAAGASLDWPVSELNLSRPDLVRSVHEAYLRAGADVVETNTFGASRYRLERQGLADRAAEINRAGVCLAQEARARAGSAALIAGSIGPLAPAGSSVGTAAEGRQAAAREQAGCLADAGADLLLFETFGDLASIVEAISAARERAPSLPVVAQMTFADDGLSIMGDRVEDVAATLEALGVMVVGVNCTLGPQRTEAVLRELARHTRLPLSAQPNAGPPVRVGDHFEYRADPEYFAEAASRFVDCGASMVGGCCGTTPSHIAAAAKRIAGRRPPGRRRPRPVPKRAPPPPAKAEASDLETTLKRGQFAVTVELRPPAGADAEWTLREAALVEHVGADAILIGPSAGYRAHMSSLAFGVLLRERLRIDTVLTATTADRSLTSLEADLLGACALGLRSVVCQTGNPPLRGDYPNTAGIWDVDSIDLIRVLRSVSGRTDRPGQPMFFLGARVNPGASDRGVELERARRKIEAGADFLVTQPVYDLEGLQWLRRQLGGGAPPMLATVMPLRDLGHAQYLRHEVPDTGLPEQLVDRVAHAGDGASEVGLEIACELLSEARDLAEGFHLSSAVGSASESVQLLREWRAR
jgi:methionine synthase I (cobalamin-dependent)/5,10-methylenetetrahydrofolate reductase